MTTTQAILGCLALVVLMTMCGTDMSRENAERARNMANGQNYPFTETSR